MNKTLIFIVGGLVTVLLISAPFIYSAMKKNDYNTLANGIQDAKRRAGVWIEEDYRKRKVYSYTDRYVNGDFVDY